jgi:hypothetical protein
MKIIKSIQKRIFNHTVKNEGGQPFSKSLRGFFKTNYNQIEFNFYWKYFFLQKISEVVVFKNFFISI